MASHLFAIQFDYQITTNSKKTKTKSILEYFNEGHIVAIQKNFIVGILDIKFSPSQY
jgi:hypothetical protein